MKTEIAGKWTDLALRLFERGASKVLRTAKQVRERWVNYIDPEIRRDRWTYEDDQKLMKEMERVGKRWSEDFARMDKIRINRPYGKELRFMLEALIEIKEVFTQENLPVVQEE